MPRRIDHIVVHHTATSLDATTADIRRMHVEGRGWDDIGYHFVIESDGTVHPGRHVDKMGAHVKGRNRHSIGVAVIGDNTVTGREWTAPQRLILPVVLRTLEIIYPGAMVVGHRDISQNATACPGLDFRWYGHVQPFVS